MTDIAADLLVGPPASGRVFEGTRRVRWGDLTARGRARFDALGAYMADIASDDFADAGLGGDWEWVVRRTVYEVRAPASFLEDLSLRTWCSGIGSRWAERRVAMRGAAGAAIDGAISWVCFDIATGASRRLPPEFNASMADAAGGRRVTTTLQHDAPPPAGVTAPGRLTHRSWALRSCDFDPFDHVNNASALTIIEDVLAERAHFDGAVRLEIEYPRPVHLGANLHLAVLDHEDGSLTVWVVGAPDDTDPGAVYISFRAISLAA